jgi:hypothetical protein
VARLLLPLPLPLLPLPPLLLLLNGWMERTDRQKTGFDSLPPGSDSLTPGRSAQPFALLLPLNSTRAAAEQQQQAVPDALPSTLHPVHVVEDALRSPRRLRLERRIFLLEDTVLEERKPWKTTVVHVIRLRDVHVHLQSRARAQ